MENDWGEAMWTEPKLWAEEHPEYFLPVLYVPPVKEKGVPLWRVVGSTVLIQVLACTVGLLIYLMYFTNVAN
jgi:hypothetical protein